MDSYIWIIVAFYLAAGWVAASWTVAMLGNGRLVVKSKVQIAVFIMILLLWPIEVVIFLIALFWVPSR